MQTEEVITLPNEYFASLKYIGRKKFSTTSNVPNIHGGLEVGDEVMVIVKTIIKYKEIKDE